MIITVFVVSFCTFMQQSHFTHQYVDAQLSRVSMYVCMCVSVCMCVCLCVVSKSPELKKRLKDLIRQREDSATSSLETAAAAAMSSSHSSSGASKDRLTGEFAMDIGM